MNIYRNKCYGKKAKRSWLSITPKQPQAKVTEHEKQLVQQKCNEMIETEFKPKYIEQPPTDNDFNYRVDIFSK